jgi:hypothetical protein
MAKRPAANRVHVVRTIDGAPFFSAKRRRCGDLAREPVARDHFRISMARTLALTGALIRRWIEWP